MTHAHARHHAPLAVACPFRNCRAGIGLPCTTGSGYHAQRRVLVGRLTDEQLDVVIEMLLQLRQTRRRGTEPQIAAAAQRITDYLAGIRSPVTT